MDGKEYISNFGKALVFSNLRHLMIRVKQEFEIIQDEESIKL